jgi:hypothetical protein
VGILGQWSRDLVTFPDGQVRTSVGGPICFLLAALRELGVASYGCAGKDWHPFLSSSEHAAPYAVSDIAGALQSPGYEIAFDEQDTARQPEVRVPSGITSLAACLRQHPACNTLVLSSIFSDVPVESLADFRESTDASIVLDIQGFQRILSTDGRIERVRADPRFFAVADVIKGNRSEFERQFGDDFRSHLITLAQTNQALYLLTDGARGVTIFEAGNEPVSVPVLERSGGSSVGAGDRFLGAFVAYRARGEAVEPAVLLAQQWVGAFLGRGS